MGTLVAICAIVGLASLLGGAIKAMGNVTVALLKYVVGPVIILAIIAGCLKCGL